MCIIMAMKSKVELSPHFTEIYTRLCEGVSARKISEWLKNEYNENISHVAISKYRKNNINLAEQVEERINEKLAAEKESDKQVQIQDHDVEKQSIEKEAIEKEADKQVQIQKQNHTVTTIMADNMLGVMGVAEQLPQNYKKMVNEAKDPDSRTSFKDVTKLTLEANKIVNDYFNKQDTELNVNVNNNLNKLFDDGLIEDILKDDNE